MKVKIYKPSKSVTQSGLIKSKSWIVEYPQDSDLGFDNLTGWAKSDNTAKQIQLKFKNFEEALKFVKKNKLNYIVIPSREKRIKIKSYSDNFKYNRIK